MADENPGDNKPPEQPLEPNLPGQVVDVPAEAQDPEYLKWAAETKDLPNAWKRMQGSKQEVEKYRTDLATAQKAVEEGTATKAQLDQISTELKLIAEKDPHLVERMQSILSGQDVKADDNKPVLAPEDRKLLDGLRAREVTQAQTTIQKFRADFKDYLPTENAWDAVREHAAALDGRRDVNGNPYTLETALLAALRAEAPQVISDRTALETLASARNRASAAEPGDVSYGSSAPTELTDQERDLIKRFKSFGVTEQGYLQRKAQTSI